MARFLPTIVGLVVVVIGFATSSGILTAIGMALFVAGIVWFVMSGTHTKLGAEAKRR
jgi:hypothetical protein